MRRRFAPALACCLTVVACFTGCDKGEPLSVSQQLDLGWEKLRVGNIDSSRLHFESAITTATSNQERAKAKFAMATSLSLPQITPDVERARKLLGEAIVLDADPGTETAPWAALLLARLGDLRDIDPDAVDILVNPDARDKYRDVMTRWPTHPAAQEARAYLVTSLVAARTPDEATEAIRLVDEFVPVNQNSPWSATLLGLKSRALRTLGRSEDRLATEIQSLELARKIDAAGTTEYAGNIWGIGIIAEFEAGDLAAARKYYNLLITEYPADQRVFNAEQALKRIDALEATLKQEIALENTAKENQP